MGLRVKQTNTRSPEDFTHGHIRQTIPTPADPIQIQVYPTFNFKSMEGGWPLAASGVEVSDGENPLLWYIFADEVAPRSYDLANGHHIEVLPAPLGQWSTVTIDIMETYRKLGWHVLDRITFDLFLAAHATHPGNYFAFFKPNQFPEEEPVPGQAQIPEPISK